MSIEVRAALLRQAEYLIRTRGYADFSYADLAAQSQITKATVHHYFPTKAALAAVLLAEYLVRFEAALEGIESKSPRIKDRMAAYGKLFLDGFEDGMLPLCGALSAERAALPEALRKEVSTFFKLHLRWLARMIRAGVAAKELPRHLDADRTALQLLSALEGGSLVGWAMQDVRAVMTAFEDGVERLLEKKSSRAARTSRKR